MIRFGAPLVLFRSLSVARGDFSGASSRKDVELRLRIWARNARTPAEKQQVIDEVIYAVHAGLVDERRMAGLTSLTTFDAELA